MIWNAALAFEVRATVTEVFLDVKMQMPLTSFCSVPGPKAAVTSVSVRRLHPLRVCANADTAKGNTNSSLRVPKAGPMPGPPHARAAASAAFR